MDAAWIFLKTISFNKKSVSEAGCLYPHYLSWALQKRFFLQDFSERSDNRIPFSTSVASRHSFGQWPNSPVGILSAPVARTIMPI